MRELTNWIIRKLGGVTSDECARYIHKYDAIKHAHEQTLSWFKHPIMRVDRSVEKYSVEIAVAFDDRYPAERIKQDMCRQMAERFFSDNLVTFDICDSFTTGEKVFRGSLDVVMRK